MNRFNNIKQLSVFVLLMLLIQYTSAQSKKSSNPANLNMIQAVVLDADTKEPLLYANVYLQDKSHGTVTNELGRFSIDTEGLNATDSICFQYIGYQARCLSIHDIREHPVILLSEKIENLQDVIVYAIEPDPKVIVKKVLENKAQNYRSTSRKARVFMRSRGTDLIDKFDLEYKKSSIPDLDRAAFESLEDLIPKVSTSFNDFMADFYFSEANERSQIKIDPVKKVALIEEDVKDPEKFIEAFEKALANTSEKEYWKFKSGIIGVKLDDEDMVVESDSDSSDAIESEGELLSWNRSEFESHLGFSEMKDEDAWEFLYKTGKYKYNFKGGTRVNGEDVYIIEFSPKGGGLFEGTMFITSESFALIRADFKYADGKLGKSFEAFGIGYWENNLIASVQFEKQGDNYVLKYCSKKSQISFKIDRKFALIKKRKSFPFDKKIQEVKIGFYLRLRSEESLEMLFLNHEPIDLQLYNDFEEPEYYQPIYVSQFDDKLWEGYDIIEPTHQMKNYKKSK